MTLPKPAILAVIAALLWSVTGAASERDVKVITGTVDDDVFVAGETVDIDASITGDVFAAGGRISATGDIGDGLVAAGGRLSVDSTVAGDVIAAGGEIRMAGSAGDNLVAAGGSIVLAGPIKGKAIAAGGSVTLERSGATAGDAWLSGGQVTVNGAVGGNLRVAAGEATILGSVGGNADIRAGQVVIGPTARIVGDLTVRSGEEPQIDPAARIGGAFTFIPQDSPAKVGLWAVGIGLGILLLPVVFALVVGAVALLMAPRYVEAMGGHIAGQPLTAFGLGALLLIGTPPLLLFLLVTVIGIPFAILGFALYVVLWALALPLVALALTDRAIRRYGTGAPRGKILLAYILALAVLVILVFIPFLGWLAIWVLAALGMGAMLLALRRGPSREVSDLPAAS